jgi:endonuclease/exonuclease/phosphatase (EEP) superfamily protein YafD
MSLYKILILGFVAFMMAATFAKGSNKARVMIPADAQTLISIGSCAPETLDPQSIKVLVWNIYKGKRENWRRDFLAMGPGHDLLLLQEAYLDSGQRQIFQDDTSFFYTMAVSFLTIMDKNPTGVATASNICSINTKWLRSADTEPLAQTPKISLLSTYPIANSPRKLLVVNIHALNLSSFDSFKRQIESIAIEIVNHQGPVIFGGDYNTRTEERTVYLQQKMRNLGFLEIPYKPEEIANPVIRKVLDHVFVRGLKVKTNFAWAQIESSDHKALSAELSVD